MWPYDCTDRNSLSERPANHSLKINSVSINNNMDFNSVTGTIYRCSTINTHTIHRTDDIIPNYRHISFIIWVKPIISAEINKFLGCSSTNEKCFYRKEYFFQYCDVICITFYI